MQEVHLLQLHMQRNLAWLQKHTQTGRVSIIWQFQESWIPKLFLCLSLEMEECREVSTVNMKKKNYSIAVEERIVGKTSYLQTGHAKGKNRKRKYAGKPWNITSETRKRKDSYNLAKTPAKSLNRAAWFIQIKSKLWYGLTQLSNHEGCGLINCAACFKVKRATFVLLLAILICCFQCLTAAQFTVNAHHNLCMFWVFWSLTTCIWEPTIFPTVHEKRL